MNIIDRVDGLNTSQYWADEFSAGYNQAKFEATQIATEADALMAEMADALDYLESRHVVEADVEYGAACEIAQTALKHYQDYIHGESQCQN